MMIPSKGLNLNSVIGIIQFLISRHETSTKRELQDRYYINRAHWSVNNKNIAFQKARYFEIKTKQAKTYLTHESNGNNKCLELN
jgi:hypothetical protein